MNKTSRYTLIFIFTTLIFRLIIASKTGLGTGESYYFRGADDLALSYLDQPPLFFWIAHLSFILFGFNTLFIRLPSVLMFSGTTWMLYLIGKYLFNARAAFYGILVFNFSALFVITGIWFQPDSALLFFWSICLYFLIQLFFPKEPLSRQKTYYLWIATGISMGFTTLSKYHVVFLVLGMFTFILTKQRYWLKHPGIYISLIINCILGLPILIWNANNEFASFVFQGSRALYSGIFTLHFEWFFRSFVGQAFWLLPWIWLPIVYQLFKSCTLDKKREPYWFCFCMAIYPIVFFTIATLWANLSYHFHWQAVGYMILFLPLGASIEKILHNKRSVNKIRAWLIFCGVFLYGLMSFAAFHMETGYWQTYGPKWLAVKATHNPNATDPTMDGYDYTDLYKYFVQHKLFNQPNLFVGASGWLLAGKVDWALKGKIDVRSFQEERNYAYYFDDKKHLGEDIIYISNFDEAKSISDIKDNCSDIKHLDELPITRNRVTELTLNVYLCKDFHSMI